MTFVYWMGGGLDGIYWSSRNITKRFPVVVALVAFNSGFETG